MRAFWAAGFVGFNLWKTKKNQGESDKYGDNYLLIRNIDDFKKNKCKSNGCTLFELPYNYNENDF